MQESQQVQETLDAFQQFYRPTRRDPSFTPPKYMHADAGMTAEKFASWLDSLPLSPISEGVRLAVSATFAAQRTRIGFGNRVAAFFATRLGASLEGLSKEEIEAKKANILDVIREEYDKVTFGYADKVTGELKGRKKTADIDVNRMHHDEDGAMLSARQFQPNDMFRSYAEYVAAHQFLVLYQFEVRQMAQLRPILSGIPIWEEFLSKVRGLGPMTSAALIASLNPYRARHASSFHAYLGLDVGPDGRGKGIRKTHMEERWFLKPSDDGKKKELGVKMSRTYNAITKSRLLFIGMVGIIKANVRWVDADDATYEETVSHMRRLNPVDRRDTDGKLVKDGDGNKVVDQVPQVCACDCEFARCYMEMKHRLCHSHQMHTGEKKLWKDCTSGHRNAAAVRYMAKTFITVFWKVWRKLEGLPIDDSYAVTKLGHRGHHKVSVWCHVGDNVDPNEVPTLRESDFDPESDDLGDLGLDSLGD